MRIHFHLRNIYFGLLLAGAGTLLAGCSALSAVLPISTDSGSTRTPTVPVVATTVTPFQPLPTDTSTPTATPIPETAVWLPDWIPAGISANILPKPYLKATSEAGAAIVLTAQDNQNFADAAFTWVYALTAPFPTISDGISSEELRAIWDGSSKAPQRLLMSDATRSLFTQIWGYSNPTKVEVKSAAELLDSAWQEKNVWAIIPFEEIAPRWKVLRVDGRSPFDRNLDINSYPLSVGFNWEAKTPSGENALAALQQMGPRRSNRDEAKLTRVVITGVTALVRLTAEKMELNGIDYPVGDISSWLLDADITHISNEVSFYDRCPPAIPVRLGVRFCSDPKYIQLLDDIDADVIELTGNHLVDFGRDPLISTLKMYGEHGMQTYGGGANLQESQKPLVIEDHGNRIAFIGCNRAGPPSDWATEDQPGSAPCDLELMTSQIQTFLAEGVLPIVTFQHYEVDMPMPGSQARLEMKQMAQAGAVIVSGSQAHYPHGFAFIGNNFVHFGLGNLFFDQMWSFNRREFIDRHIIYDGRYLGTEVLTAMLEDYARPRPMTGAERTKMLTEYFTVSGWTPND